MMKRIRLPLSIAFTLWAALALASEPFGIRAFGDFKRMTGTGDTAGVVKLRELPAAPDAFGMGALAGLRGEVLLWEGKPLVTRGHSEKGSVEPASPADEAVMFVVAQVEAWDQIVVPNDMTQAQFEAFVLRTAASRGLDAEHAFPFVVKGDLPRVQWHVVMGSAPKHGDPKGHASIRAFDQAGVTAILLGFHSGAALEGVISHPGERFHVHYASRDLSVSGHVDEYRVAKGALLRLPRK